MAKYIKLTPEQKDEIRRLTQLANRRIKTAQKNYAKQGKDIVPLDIVGKKELQTKDRWHTKNQPLSRTVKFENEKEYRNQINFLRSFDPKLRKNARPTLKEYTKTLREKTAMAVETGLGMEIPDSLVNKLNKMSAPELADFWQKFSDNASRLGLQYSSDVVMLDTMNELFPEDMQRLAS